MPSKLRACVSVRRRGSGEEGEWGGGEWGGGGMKRRGNKEEGEWGRKGSWGVRERLRLDWL